MSTCSCAIMVNVGKLRYHVVMAIVVIKVVLGAVSKSSWRTLEMYEK